MQFYFYFCQFMKMSNRNITIKAVIYLMIAFVIMLMVNKSLFIHTHIMPDGTVVVHAHPYNKTSDSAPIKSHNHSKLELVFLANLQLLMLISFFVLVLLVLSKKIKLSTDISFNYTSLNFLFQKGRSPPIF